MSFYASLILFINVSCLITSDIQPEPQQLALKMRLMIQNLEDHNKDGSTTGNESDQETKTSEDDTMTADEEDNRELPATAGAGQSTSEM